MELKFRPILMNHGRDLLQKVPWHTANPTALIEFYLVFFGTNVWNPNLMNVSIVQYLDKFTFCTENMNMGSKAVSSRPPTPGHCSWSSIWALLPHHWVFPHLLLGLSVRCPGSVIFAGEWLKLFAEPVIWQSMLRLSFFFVINCLLLSLCWRDVGFGSTVRIRVGVILWSWTFYFCLFPWSRVIM